MKPTIKMIAQKAGVSLATVSNALNNKRGVSPATIKLVMRIAEESGYDVNTSKVSNTNPQRSIRAIRLITFRKHGLVIQDTPFFTELIHSIESECFNQGFELLFAQIQAWEPDDCRRLEQLLLEADVANLLLATEMEQEDLVLLAHVKSPILLLDSYFKSEDWNAVTINNYEAGYRAARFLIDHGHHKIGLITSSSLFNNIYYRWSGYRDALETAGLAVNPEFEVKIEPTLEGSYRDMKRWLEAVHELPTAFFAANDVLAVGAMRALKEFGVKIPEDLSIIGMDDTPICLAVNPPLSTIHVYIKEMAEIAVHRLLKIVQNDTGARNLIEVGIHVVERQSVSVLSDNNGG